MFKRPWALTQDTTVISRYYSIIHVLVHVYVVTLFICKWTFLSNILGPGIAEGDENCKKFMEKTIPDAFQKVSRLLIVPISSR